jgi:hypothetical protein
MIQKPTIKVMLMAFAVVLFFGITWEPARSADRTGRIALNIAGLKNSNTVFKTVNLVSTATETRLANVEKTVRNYSLLRLNENALTDVLNTAPENISLSIPSRQGNISLQLYKVDISPNGFTLLTSDGRRDPQNKIVHYRGIMENDMNSVVSFSVSREETMGMISTDAGNFIFGKLDGNNGGLYVFYNDKEMAVPFTYDCGANTSAPVQPYSQGNGISTFSTKCVNWYYETDYDIYVGKGSLAAVNSYIQGAFNQVATLYNNDGISVTLQTLYVWTTSDPYTGPSTSDYLNQFGAYRTTFAGNLATLIGYAGGGGIAYVNGLCSSSSQYKMGYTGINSSYNTVPTYSWTVEVLTHEDGHLLGSKHTHDCVWNGNNTRIDGCGPAAGYSSGTCAAGPIPSGGGTIMSYCHLLSGTGINFNLGFGPQPASLILNNVNNASCLSACSSCTPPAQPATVSGAVAPCQGSSQVYSVAAVSGATSYTWTLPSGWSGSSTTNSITVTSGSTAGNISVIANNSCGSSAARTYAVSPVTVPSQPGTISGSASVCAGSSITYSVSGVSGATSYSWILPSGWSGSSTSNSITVTAGTTGGTISVTASNGCGTSAARTLAVTIGSGLSQPAAISGNTAPCQGSIISYSVTAVSGAASYSWSIPSGWSGSSTSNSITVTAGSGSGSITVAAVNGCGQSAPRSVAVASVTLPGMPSVITAPGTTKACPGETKTYSITALAGASSYSWTAPAGTSIAGGQGTTSVTLNILTGFTGGTLSVTATNSCGTGAARTLSIVLNTPTLPSAITGPNAGVCNKTNVAYSVTNVSGMNYSWSFNSANAIITSGQGTSGILVNFNSGYTNSTLTVIASNGCGTSTSRTLSVKPNPAVPTAITGSTSVCANQQGVPYSTTAVYGATSYTWTVPTGARISDGTVTSTTTSLTTTATSVTVNWKTTAGNVRVKSNNACGSSSNRALSVSISCRESFDAISSGLNVFPNPAHGELTARYEAAEAGTIKLKLSDLSGKMILSKISEVTEGENNIAIDILQITPGIYFLELTNGENKKVVKVSVY